MLFIIDRAKSEKAQLQQQVVTRKVSKLIILTESAFSCQPFDRVEIGSSVVNSSAGKIHSWMLLFICTKLQLEGSKKKVKVDRRDQRSTVESRVDLSVFLLLPLAATLRNLA